MEDGSNADPTIRIEVGQNRDGRHVPASVGESGGTYDIGQTYGERDHGPPVSPLEPPLLLFQVRVLHCIVSTLLI